VLESPLLSGSSFALRWFLSWQQLILVFSLVIVVGAWDQALAIESFAPLNSGYAEQQPALSGDGRYLAFVSDRLGGQQIFVYDLQQQQFLNLQLNQPHAVMDSPSLSATGRYIVYAVSFQGKSEIYLYDRATRRSQVLIQRYLGEVRHPHISAEGRYVVFEGSQAGRWDIEVFDRGAAIELDTP
jgi:Tol biopolymer transport system component